MKNFIKKAWNRIVAGIKKVPAKVYVFLIVTIILVGLQLILFKPYGEILVAHKDLYIEQSNIFAHKSAEHNLMNELFLKEQSLRDDYINVDLNNISNPITLFASYILMHFAKLDIIGQSFIVLGLVLVDCEILRKSLQSITKKFFSNRKKRLNSKHA